MAKLWKPSIYLQRLEVGHNPNKINFISDWGFSYGTPIPPLPPSLPTDELGLLDLPRSSLAAAPTDELGSLALPWPSLVAAPTDELGSLDLPWPSLAAAPTDELRLLDLPPG